MFKRSEFFFQGAQKTKLFCQIWEPAEVRGHLIITHGQAEHSGCYHRLVEGLKDLSLAVYAWDLRGHGRSDGKRGYVAEFRNYSQDLQFLIHHLRDERGLYPKDLFLLGHSMGGLIQLMTQLESPHWSFKAQVLSAPMLGVAVDVPIYKDVGALIFSKLLPTLTLDNEIKYENLTRDEKVLHEFKTDVLRHHRISSEAYLGALMCIEKLRESAAQIQCPALIQIPSKDPVIDSESTRQFFKKLNVSTKLLIEYQDRKHEIYNDIGRQVAYQDVVKFLAQFN